MTAGSSAPLAGVLPLARLSTRLDRVRVGVWALGLAAMTVMVASTWNSLYPTAESRLEFAASISATPALVGLLGPLYDATSTGALTSWRIGAPLAFVLGVVSVFLVARHSRADEADGRRDVQMSGVVARPAPVVAAMAPAVLLSVGFTALVVLGMAALGESPLGALAFGLVVAGGGLSVAALTDLLALALPTTRAVRAAGVFLASLAFVVFILANSRSDLSWLRWLTPSGWVGEARAFAGERWEVVVLPWVAAAVLVSIAALAGVRRDVGAALIRFRRGRSHAAGWLSGPAGITWRVERTTVIGWIAGLGVLGVIVGYVMKSMIDLIEGSPQMSQLLERMGGVSGAADSYIVVMMSILSVGVAAFGVAGVLRARGDEAAGRTAAILATPTSRVTWLAVRVAAYAVATAVMLAVLGVALGVGYGDSVAGTVGSALVSWPAVLLVMGFAVAVYGRWPVLWWLPWLVIAYSVIVGQFGALIGLPEWTQDTTPFALTPLWPAEDIVWWPLLASVAGGVALVALGVDGFRRRAIA